MNRQEFPRVTPESVGIHSADLLGMLRQFEQSNAELHSLLIMRHGQICLEAWWAPYAPDIVHGLQSHTKTYAATAVGVAVTQGYVRLADRIVELFPDLAPSAPSENLRLMTVHDVLCMGCGIETMPQPTKDWIRDFLATPVVHRPGTAFMYNSLGSTLLCAIVERVTGRKTADFLKSELFDKIGIAAADLLWEHMPDGIEVGGGGLYAKTEDNLRLMKLYADGGVWNGERLLSDDFVRRATTRQIDSASERLGNPQATDNFLGYGYQIWMCQPQGVYRADGAMGQFTIVVPDRDLIIAMTETATGAHWAQNSLNIIWEFLAHVEPGDQAWPENPEAVRSLTNKLATLALPTPPKSRPGPLASQINDVLYRRAGEGFQLSVSAIHSMSGQPLPAPVDQFSLHFAEDQCQLTILQAGQTHHLQIALDGTRAANTLPIATVTQVLLSGDWLNDKTFEITARWIQTCYEKKITCSFVSDSLIEVSTRLSVGLLDGDIQSKIFPTLSFYKALSCLSDHPK